MFRFQAPDVLWALLLVPLLVGLVIWSARTRRRLLKRFGDAPLVARLARSVHHRGRRIRAALLIAAVGLLVLALARPQFGTRLETVRSVGRDVMVVLDVSASMRAEDVQPSRLERARLEIGRLVRGLDGDRVGLVAFAGDAFVQAPLTSDYGAALLFLGAMDTDLIPIQGTNLGLALDVALEGFEAAAAPDDRVMIVVTDGEDHEGEIATGIERAREAGVRVHTVGIGTPEGAPIPVFDAAGGRDGFLRDDEGNVVTTRLEEGTLVDIAERTGGRYVPAYADPAAFRELVDEVARGTGTEREERQVRQYEEQYQLFLGLAFALLLVETTIPERKKVEEEWTGRF